MIKKLSAAAAVTLSLVFAVSGSALAHVVVSPNAVKPAERQVFSVGVPNESDSAQVVGVRLVVPDGLQYVTPNTKPGWTIDIKKTGEGESAKVTELIWSGGTVPTGQRDDFVFKAQAPDKSTDLIWKAYETYSDGTTVAWDQKPNDSEESTPYSVTKVSETAADTSATGDHHNNTDTTDTASDAKATTAIVISVIAGVLAVTALVTKRNS